MRKAMLSWGDAPMFLLILALGLATCAEPTAAQRPARPDPQLVLARIGASECGLSCADHELAAIADVLRSRATRLGLTFDQMARAYSGRVFDTERRDPRAWIADLHPSGREPAGWPEFVTRRATRREGIRIVPHLPWSAARPRWLQLYETAGRVLANEVPSWCSEPVDHWGMRSGIDHARATRAGWTEVDCGETRNAFWRVPRATDADRD